MLDHMIGSSIYYSKRGRSESPTGRNPIVKPKIRNEAIELELQIFKKEIEEKFAASEVNKNFKFPRKDYDRIVIISRPTSSSRLRRTMSIDKLASIKKIKNKPIVPENVSPFTLEPHEESRNGGGRATTQNNSYNRYANNASQRNLH